MIEYPLFVFDGFDLDIFLSESGVGSLEHQDIERGVYRCFDDKGYCVRLEIKRNILRLHREELCVAEFHDALRASLELAKSLPPQETNIEELKTRARRIFDVYGTRD